MVNSNSGVVAGLEACRLEDAEEEAVVPVAKRRLFTANFPNKLELRSPMVRLRTLLQQREPLTSEVPSMQPSTCTASCEGKGCRTDVTKRGC